MIGVIVGFLGMLSVLVGPAIHDAIIPPPPAEEQLTETIVSLKQRITAKLKMTAPPPEASRGRLSSEELPHNLSLAFAGLAIIGWAVY